jgi:transketolase C-terminal domain/subunit
MANLTMVQAINLALIQEMEKDERVLLLGEDVGNNGGVFRVTEGLQKRFGAKRVVDTPLAESGIIGTAIGRAACAPCPRSSSRASSGRPTTRSAATPRGCAPAPAGRSPCR